MPDKPNSKSTNKGNTSSSLQARIHSWYDNLIWENGEPTSQFASNRSITTRDEGVDLTASRKDSSSYDTAEEPPNDAPAPAKTDEAKRSVKADTIDKDSYVIVNFSDAKGLEAT